MSTRSSRVVRVALYYITASYAQLERGTIWERVTPGMDWARNQGKQIRRPKVTDRRGFRRRFCAILERLGPGGISRFQVARELKIGCATLKRLLDAQNPTITEESK
jgi:DNA invertase Pin-like site-specific DNA recombinase